MVLELFTSQGCSSCPPADRLLEEIKDNPKYPQVIILSYHVDYWNSIGWKDPFSKSEFSEKQRRYGEKFNNSSVYTPQLVINGKEHFVGSNESILKSKIKSYSKLKSEYKIAILNVKKNGQLISFDYKIDGRIDDVQLRIALSIDERTTSVARGENKNRTLKNSNIVVEEVEIILNSNSGNGIIKIPKIVTSSDALSLTLILETADLDIVAGTQIKL